MDHVVYVDSKANERFLFVYHHALCILNTVPFFYYSIIGQRGKAYPRSPLAINELVRRLLFAHTRDRSGA